MRVALECVVKMIFTFFGSSVTDEIVAFNIHAKLIVANFILANVTDLDVFMVGVKALLTSDRKFVSETKCFFDSVDNMVLEVIHH